MNDEFVDPAYAERSIEDIKESCGIDDLNTIKALADNNYGFFLEHVLGLNTDSDLIQEAIDLVNDPPEQTENKATKIAVMAPRGHSKTYSWTVGRALYVGYTETNKRIILTSASRSQSIGILEKIKRIIERNELLNFLKPSPANREMLAETMDMQDDEGAWAAKSVVLTSDVTIKTKTFGSSIRSEHVDYVFADDILSDEKSGNKSKGEEKDVFYEVVSPIVENKAGTLQVVGTPQSHNDLLQELLNKPNYYSTQYQAYYPEDDRVLWPWNWTVKGLQQKKEEVGPARFAREYMCDPMSVEEQFFGWDDCVEPNLDEKYDEEHWRPKMGDEYEDWSFFIGVDIALSDSSGADYTVATVLGVDPEENAWLVDLRREKGMSPPEIADMITQLDDKYRFSNGLVEKNAIGEGVWDTISREASLSGRIKSFDTTRKTRPEILSQLQAALYRNQLVLHRHDELIDEMLAFHKKESGKLEGKGHDDTVMSLAIAFKAANLGDTAPTSVTIIDESGSEVEIDEDDMEEGIDGIEIDDGSSGSVGIV